MSGVTLLPSSCDQTQLIIIIIIIIIIPVIPFMHGIYNYIPEKTTFLRYKVLQLFCIYNLRYT